MARSTFKVLFYVNGSKEKNGIVPIMGRVTINGTVAQFSCKQSIPKTLWDVKGNKAKGKSREARDINLALDNIKAQIIKHYQRISDREAFVTAEMVCNAYQGIGTEYDTLIKAFDKDCANFLKHVSKDRSIETYISNSTRTVQTASRYSVKSSTGRCASSLKKLLKIFVAMAVIVMPFVSCSQTTKKSNMKSEDNNALVCYFSATGTTADAARRISKIANADIYEIEPAKKYTSADLDWTDSLNRSSVEMHNRSFRPALKDTITDLSKYSVIFIGYPNWWNTHPTIINTFIENNNLQGKTIVPFMTSGGSNILNSEKELKEQYPSLTFVKGMLMNSKSDSEIKEWIEQLNLL